MEPKMRSQGGAAGAHHVVHAAAPINFSPPPVAPGGSKARWWGGLAIVAALAGAGVWEVQGGGPGPAASAPVALAARMKAVSEGASVAGIEAGGGKEGKAIVARHVPHKECVASAWTLARTGVVVIDGVFSQRLSAGKLADLCADGASGSTLEWYPR